MPGPIQPYISVVAASRNDDHGGDPLHRTQIFINCFVQQCQRFKLPAELILVDWNPVKDRPGLAAALRLPEPNGYCSGRVITVPAPLHDTIKYGDRLAFFQMIAKNVGIRRARGSFVLATNIDIVFSNELVAFLARRVLDPKRLYRVDRFDFKADLPVNAGVGIVIDRAWESIIRTNRRANLQEVIEPLYGHDPACRDCTPHIQPGRNPSDKITLVHEDGVWQLRPHPASPIEHLNTNACGDFTLLAKEAWEAIGGYPEFEAFSFNIDSMGLVAAHYQGYHETSLLPPHVCFHIEHSLGSGYTPEGEQTLFERLRARRILNPDWPVLNPWVAEMRASQTAIQFNRGDWGLAGYTLSERPFGETNPPEPHFPAHVVGSAGALRPQYDLDSATLFHERESLRPPPKQQAKLALPPVPAAADTQALPALKAAQAAVVVPAPRPSLPRPAPPVLQKVRAREQDLFAHSHDSYFMRDHYGAGYGQRNKSLMVWGSALSFERVKALLSPHLHGKVCPGVAGDVPARDCDGLLTATDPRQLVRDLLGCGLLIPRKRDSELAIWVTTDGHEADRASWVTTIKLARRLLEAAGWRVTAESLRTFR